MRPINEYVNLSQNKIENHLKTQTSAFKEEVAPADSVTYKLGQFFWSNLFGFVYHYLKSRFGKRFPYQSYPKSGDLGVYQIPAEARLVLLSDWATDTIESDLVGRLANRYHPDYSLHLGDVYFVGTSKEIRANFLNPDASWPWGKNGSLVLSGNHEMYSNGRAFFQELLPTMWIEQQGIRKTQQAGFFCLENDYWRIIGLDTGYTSVRNPILEVLSPPDCRLKKEQLSWLKNQVRLDNPDDQRGIIFLSHHPVFSVFRHFFPKPADQIRELFGLANRSVAWIWGHEHQMVVYQTQHLNNGLTVHGRCIGHGGMPVEMNEPESYTPILFMDDRVRTRLKRREIGYNGFVYLTLEGPRAVVKYIDVEDTMIYQEHWQVENGKVIVEKTDAT
ncbi:MAG: metallophosphoesterase [Siphonobacter sp.]